MENKANRTQTCVERAVKVAVGSGGEEPLCGRFCGQRELWG